MDTVDRINDRLKKLLDYVSALEKHRGVDPKKLESDSDLAAAIERYLQLACEVVIDIANLLNAEFRFRPAADSRDGVIILGETGVLEKDFAEELSKLVGFRNILVHDYLEIDYKIVADAVNTRLDDLRKFAKAVASYLS